MKKNAQITLIIIAINFGLIEILFLDESFKKESIDLVIAVSIAWFIGRQYDKMKFYMKRTRESEDNYKQLIETLPESILIHNQNRILYVNKAGENMLGAQRKSEILGRSIHTFIYSKDYQELATKRLKQLLEKSILSSNVEQKLLRLDGKVIFVEVSSRVIIFEGKEAILSTVKDVTDKRQEAEILLQKSEKLALIGQMAAGIAHEIRNPLTSIKGFIQLFKSKYKSEEEHFNLVLSELERINLIVGEFLVLAKPTAREFKKREITSLLKDVVMLINAQAIMNNIQIFLECESDIPHVICEENQLKQVFVNILKNAIEAMPNGGIIDVKIKKKEKNRVSIYFIDQGLGIQEDRLLTLGEPFYTTKEKGTGLGLMVSYKIVESHGGELKISSKVNRGTTVEVILPIVPKGHAGK
ncbi:ATP-binding protein [Priestia aryabhattai]|uniref:ATP-binding protein n=2 Tax=Priestia aryabhattai TaxID=412384 RepID=UPI0024536217|nr:ATP-binding protein [Priestia aryabhattai]MDH3111130.1 ATP-binding protein [Priestia aryabhattai]MDH3129798.1 ATP-binding protein [Priestia aryabhattai]